MKRLLALASLLLFTACKQNAAPAESHAVADEVTPSIAGRMYRSVRALPPLSGAGATRGLAVALVFNDDGTVGGLLRNNFRLGAGLGVDDRYATRYHQEGTQVMIDKYIAGVGIDPSGNPPMPQLVHEEWTLSTDASSISLIRADGGVSYKMDAFDLSDKAYRHIWFLPAPGTLIPQPNIVDIHFLSNGTTAPDSNFTWQRSTWMRKGSQVMIKDALGTVYESTLSDELSSLSVVIPESAGQPARTQVYDLVESFQSAPAR